MKPFGHLVRLTVLVKQVGLGRSYVVVPGRSCVAVLEKSYVAVQGKPCVAAQVTGVVLVR